MSPIGSAGRSTHNADEAAMKVNKVRKKGRENGPNRANSVSGFWVFREVKENLCQLSGLKRALKRKQEPRMGTRILA